MSEKNKEISISRSREEIHTIVESKQEAIQAFHPHPERRQQHQQEGVVEHRPYGFSAHVPFALCPRVVPATHQQGRCGRIELGNQSTHDPRHQKTRPNNAVRCRKCVQQAQVHQQETTQTLRKKKRRADGTKQRKCMKNATAITSAKSMVITRSLRAATSLCRW